jgi:hypothetical protein
LDVRGRVLPIVAAIALACALPGGAWAGIVFQFAPTNPKAGSNYIQVRAIPTPAGYDGVALPDSARVLDLYLVRHAVAPTVHSVADPRLIPLGRFDPVHVSPRYRLPKLATATYAMAATCLNCASHELYVIGVGPHMRGPEPVMLLHATATPSRFWPFAIVTLLAAALAVALWWIVSKHRRRRREPLMRAVTAVHPS